MHDFKSKRRMISAAATVLSSVLEPWVSVRIASEGMPWLLRYARPTSPSVKVGSPPEPPVVRMRGAHCWR
jgi:hypothetical protein